MVQYFYYLFYRPPTKLWEGNIFTGVCHSVGGGGPHDVLDLTVQPPPLADMEPPSPC